MREIELLSLLQGSLTLSTYPICLVRNQKYILYNIDEEISGANQKGAHLR